MSVAMLEKFAQEKGKELTSYPICVKLSHGIVYRTSDGALVLAGLSIESYSLGIIDDFRYVIYIGKWVYKTFKDRMYILKKLICHELAHIIHRDHSREFTELALRLGAGDCSFEGACLLKITSPWRIFLLTTFGFGHLVRKDFPEEDKNYVS